MVNMALESSHKLALLQCGALSDICAAMDRHPDDPEVLYRALFALINLVTLGGVSQCTGGVAETELLAVRVMRATTKFQKSVDIASRGCMVRSHLQTKFQLFITELSLLLLDL